ncbi:tryptophan 2,3-dioxygenase [Actinomadura rupiterrae]|uniref:tryptophan 2,3-dioxygenase n=1 Tax=Actinomadura rupiterrae TaxID=559627 RepID=UPI0020A46C81|nr:tryptophan 2,3-dioxygenase family protein [Actinomadura rupiterrae]MCP2341462.1 tryptophan 2,3-dioxygenase [Actinomadura rupiterrae]
MGEPASGRPDGEALTYGGYLALDRLLDCQEPRTRAHDELLFVIIHQVYELWFKQILHEADLLQRRLEDGDSAGALGTARRIAKILKTVVGQLDVLETMTPRQFASFRDALGTSSGFQSAQFRQIEAVLGRRTFPASDLRDDEGLKAAVARRSLMDSLMRYLSAHGYPVPDAALRRDPSAPWRSDPGVQEALLKVYADDGGPAAEVCEALVDIDEGVQEWRYRHVKMVERTIGAKLGTGGSAGADYLRSTLFVPAFPDLWEVRSRIDETVTTEPSAATERSAATETPAATEASADTGRSADTGTSADTGRSAANGTSAGSEGSGDDAE